MTTVINLFISDGTPVIDIKPYICNYDAPLEPPCHPDWIHSPPSARVSVTFTDLALTDIQCIFSQPFEHKMRFIKNEEELRQCITDIVEADPRSVYRKQQGNVDFSFPIDTVDVFIKVTENVLTVTGVKQSEYVKMLLNFKN